MRLVDSDKMIEKLEDLKLTAIANGESETVLKMYQWMIGFTTFATEVINIDTVIESLKKEKENLTNWSEDLAYENAIDRAIEILNNSIVREEVKTDFGYVFPERLKKKLEENNISQRELAEKCDITEVTMSRYVNGNRVPNAVSIVRIARALKCSIDELLY